MSSEKLITEVDAVQLYFGEPLIINKYIQVKSPTIGDFIKLGESKYFEVLHNLTAIPSDMKAALWDMGICWMDISDFDFFYLLTRNLTSQDTEVFLGDLDLSKFNFEISEDTKEHYMYQELDNGDFIIVDEEIYSKIVQTLRFIHNIDPKPEKVKSDSMKELLVELNREDIEKSKKERTTSAMLPLISSMLNSTGFKYNIFTIKKITYFAFMDSVRRIPVIANASAMLSGIYGGWVDTSKLDKKALDWMRDLYIKQNISNQKEKKKKR